MQKSMEIGLFHTRPIRTRAACSEISWSPSRSNHGFVYSQIKISAAQVDHRLHQLTGPQELLSRCCTFNATL